MESQENNRSTYLQELKGSDFEIEAHQPDIIGWEIVDNTGHELGEVKDLIFDSHELKVRYIVSHVDVDINHDGDDELQLVLIPIGIVDLDEEHDKVVVPERYAAFIDTLPQYNPGHTITPGEELTVRQAFMGQSATPGTDVIVYEEHPENFYMHEHFDDTRFTKRISNNGTIPGEEIIQ